MFQVIISILIDLLQTSKQTQNRKRKRKKKKK